MLKKKLFVSIVMTLGLVFTACGKKASNNSEVIATTSGSSTEEVTPIPNHKTKPLDLGIAKSFGVMAYISITSAPTSSIYGKVGLKPGARSLIAISPAEVTGGRLEIYAGDDVGDPQNYLTMAREDLIGAYRDAAGRPTDRDKLEAYKGNLGGKILPPGVYRWSNGAVIPSDVSLEGNGTDVWIFQVDGNLDVAENTRVHLSGRAQAKNIFWQVSGKVTLGSRSVISGTIMNQLTFELKPGAQVNGRVLCKNGKVLLSQNSVSIPER